ncbi:MAG: CHAT domain-containing tetratricopeptide repeat protein [Bryobacteraceae bacterium]
MEKRLPFHGKVWYPYRDGGGVNAFPIERHTLAAASMSKLVPVILLFLLMTGRPTPGLFPRPAATPPGVLQALRETRGFIADFRFEEALRRLSSLDGYPAQGTNPRVAASIHLYRAICQQRLFRFAEAIPEYARARQAALDAGDRALAGTAAHNLSNLHLQSFALRPALAASEEALQLFPVSGNPDTRLQMEIHYARLLARTGDPERSIERLYSLLGATAFSGNRSLEGWVWEALGFEHLRRRDLDAAEEALSRAFYIRTLAGDPEAAASLWWLGELRLEQNDPAAALRLFDAATLLRGPIAATLPRWRPWSMRARALLATGHLAEGLNFFRRAVEAVDRSRLDLLPADSWRVEAGAGVDMVFDGYVDALLAAPGSPDLAELAQAAAGRRAASLRTDPAWIHRVRQSLPSGYWDALNRLQFLQESAFRAPSPALDRDIAQTRARMAELEGAAGAASVLANLTAPPMRLSELASDQAVLVFHAGRNNAFLLAGTPGGWHLIRLPAGEELIGPLRRFKESVENGAASGGQQGEALYRMLFASLPPETLRRRRWLFLLDDELFEAPFSALVTGFEDGREHYLVESHAIRMAAGLLPRRASAPDGPVRSFLGVGDPVYNSADPRAAAIAAPPAAAPLSRLAGSGREVESCAALFPERSVLTGPDANLDRISNALAASPGVIHIASHAVPAPDSPRETLLALSLGPAGAPELLSPEWVTSHPVSARIVVMNGCRSGSGDILPGEGLMGLTRAWLYAGAQTVLATYWPTLDDSGDLMAEFYRRWGGWRESAVPPEEALQQAQMAMIAMGGWRAEPKYWGAYFLSGVGR